MKIENEFRVSVGLDRAWSLLTDIPAIAPCLPGAELRDHDGDDYHGVMKVRVGPVSAEYAGTATVVEMDEDQRVVRLSAQGRDSRGAGNASAEILATMRADGEETVVMIATDLTVSGKVAQFGRGVMADVSKKLLGQFADCIEQSLAAAPDDPPATDAAPVDVLDVAGGALAKRIAPIVALAVVLIVVYRLVRR